jgi:hypothetical protein
MDSLCTRRRTSFAAALLALAGTPLMAQDRAVTVGLGTGVSSLPTRGADPQVGRFHSLLTVAVIPARGRVELRGDLMWAHWASYAGPVSATANVVVPVGSVSLGSQVRARPFVLAGTGYYGVGTPAPEVGANVGAGVRFEGSRLGAFVEGRRHRAYSRTFLTLGVAWRP